MNKDSSIPKTLDDILDRVRHIGPEPKPTEDQVMDTVVDVIRTARTERASAQEIEDRRSGSRPPDGLDRADMLHCPYEIH